MKPRSSPRASLLGRKKLAKRRGGSPVTQVRHSRLLPAKVQKKKETPKRKKVLKPRSPTKPSASSPTSSVNSTTTITTTNSSSSTSSTTSSTPVLLYLPLIITEADRKWMITALLLAHFTALFSVLLISGYATFQLDDLINSPWSILDEVEAFDVEILLLALLNGGLVVSHVAAAAFAYLLTFNRYRISFISAGHFNTAALLLTIVVGLTSASALVLLLTEHLAAASYESLFLEHISHARIDRTQIILQCCGARRYTDWFQEPIWKRHLGTNSRCPPWEKSESFLKAKEWAAQKEEASKRGEKVVVIHKDDNDDNDGGGGGDNGNDDNEKKTKGENGLLQLLLHRAPCLHFTPPDVMRHSDVTFLLDNNYLAGCAGRFNASHLWTVHRHGLGWAVSAGVHLFTSLLFRYFYHSVTFSLLWSRRADGSGLGWAKGVSPKRISSLEALVAGNQRLAWRWPVRLKKQVVTKDDEEEDEEEEGEEGDDVLKRRRRKNAKPKMRRKGSAK
ncbi:hypothetical protein TYRP_016524 [Tyrophagus putrescentiae]|nr:hypothetical protein TYRP_016524 [Tyrophagus putrescentiae]